MAKIKAFAVPADDPFASEHAAIQRWVREAAELSDPLHPWKNVDLKQAESGRVLRDADPERARRLLLAAIAQARHWHEQGEELRASLPTDLDRLNIHLQSIWTEVSVPRQHTATAIRGLISRSLPLQADDVVQLLTWTNPGLAVADLAYVIKALQRYAAANHLDSVLLPLMRGFAASLRTSYDKRKNRMGTLVERICEIPGVLVEQSAVTVKEPPEPAPAGHPLVLYDLKCFLGMTGTNSDLPRIQTGPDRFQMPVASPFVAEHEQLTELVNQTVGTVAYHSPKLSDYEVGRKVFACDPVSRGRVLLAAAERHIAALLFPNHDYDDTACWQSRYSIGSVVASLLRLPVQLDRESLFDLLLYLSMRPQGEPDETYEALLSGVKSLTSLSEGERFVLHVWRAARIQGPPLGVVSPDIQGLTLQIGDQARFYLVPGESWSDVVNSDLAHLAPGLRSRWIELLKHLLTATSPRPTERWKSTAKRLLSAIGEAPVQRQLERWFPLVSKGRTMPKIVAFIGDTRTAADTFHHENAIALRGLLWLVPLLTGRESMLRMLSSVALSAYKKIPGVGPRAVKVGNAAVYALSEIVTPESVGQLAMLKVRVRFGTAQKEIEKAFDAAADALQLPRDQIEEMSVPACGLENVGRRDEAIGEYRAELVVTGSDANLCWFDRRGKQLKSAPASVKKDDAETFKELQQGLKDVGAMLTAQRERIDSLFLARKSWPQAIWRERYLDHPLVGTIARRLIWCVGEASVTVVDGQAVDVAGKPVEIPKEDSVTLWHPAGRSVSEVVAWRRRIESLGIVQPFKQAHREVYVLTDAERHTATYSNRFAAHVLRQHQFSALCAARGWKNKLRLMVDDCYLSPSRELPEWGLRAEFWIEGIGTEYGADTNESGVFLRLATDQVRFYRIGAAANVTHAFGGGYLSSAGGPGQQNINEPISLEEVPPLVFSEVMRDVDLFVGVASIGNDPTWQDGGPGGVYRDYWQSYSFGELTGTAISRRETLQQLLPRLKIAGRCTLVDRFLIVRGDKCTYKIHLGSGNILMEPNDEYLCIVPGSRGQSSASQLYLPFEGDGTLSIILSKAFLLAEDWKIKDPTINRQIDRS